MSGAESCHGTLYGVGVGPGDPELVTLKAVRILRGATVVAFFAKRGRVGNARTIAAPYLSNGVQELRLEYPFTTEVPVSEPRYADTMGPFYDDCAERVAGHLTAGRDVAVLCEGDPFLYGSFMYLHDRLAGHFASEVVPGVPGMGGCWAQAEAPIAQGDDVLTILPGTLTEDELARRLAATDAAVIMKVGRNLPRIRAALTRAGLLERALLVERGTMPDGRSEPLATRAGDHAAPYFSIVLIPGRRGAR
ncbi:precorrin-2 C20-methyltransferase [Thioflavicoccus mobilis 8321]|uniref:Precorrin-2 C20-methyltransferase n=1 Tax=Thioflavicoccus mobilis 8321 TaxID=765912 RepID=L0H2D7_9GAMM|nr:precorrin-2 C(20)-methyltransferase [Thioflavicoccus mobilis]AGA92212.1 precorrin-2 C20-methyltransferase [Thioflavicoccus mobilis 8321]